MPDKIHVRSYDEYKAHYDKTHTSEKPKRGVAEGFNYWLLAAVFIMLVAVNIVSGAHTVPTLYKNLEVLIPADMRVGIAVAGFFAIEFPMLIFSFMEFQSGLRKWIVGLALIAAIGANVYSSLSATNTDGATPFTHAISILIGVIVPLVNVATGELLRHMMQDKKKREDNRDEVYNTKDREYEKKVRTDYNSYLSRMGIKDADQRLQAATEGNASNPTRVETTEHPVIRTSWTAETLAAQMTKDKTENMTSRDLQKRYSTGPGTIQKAKALLGTNTLNDLLQ